MEDYTNMYMPVAPAYGVGNQNGFGFGGDWAWILLLLVLFGNNGWGNGNGGMNGLYPWMNNSQNINDGFRDQMLNSQLSAIQAAQNANQSAMQTQLAQCCCENRLATANLNATILSEGCADRSALSDGIRDLMAANTANTNAILGVVNGGIQSIKDQLCQDKIDQKNDTIAQLRSELMYARGQASQDVQTAQIIANNNAQTAALEQYLAPIPRPAYVVQNPNCCQQTTCGCSTGCGI